ncbi:uncharacterized protein SCHCODRAFT_02680820 [Schizophyllum commune H4-8]|nr:uncharacterized protein SCHCODRAFT_02680820 [Schizophyllum commune H4-8]KAI5887893.1 hypothetical protein SCHCODRAFT_02680820 [Schizophyllum commune H4-8]
MSDSWSPTALPDSNAVPQLEDSRGYEKVLELERRYSTELGDLPALAKVGVLKTSIMHLRVIGWCYVYLHLSCRPLLTRWVLSCEDDSIIVDLGRFLCQHYLRAFRKNKGPIPVDSSHPSRSSFDRRRDALEHQIISTPPDHRTASRRARERDNDQCVITKRFHSSSPIFSTETPLATKQAILQAATAFQSGRRLEDLGDPRNDLPGSVLECAHILSESTNMNIDTNDYKKAWAASVWGILECFGHGKLREELQGSSMHRLENVMSMCHDWHVYFDELDMWLEHVEDHRYRVCITKGTGFLRDVYSPDGIIEFTTPNEKIYPLPSRKYIGLHAAACKVAHMSGAANHFQKIDRALEEDGVLAEDGHQMYVLEDRLRQVAVK